MRLANLNERLVLVGESATLDVETASGGRFSSRPQDIYEVWEEFLAWASTQDVEAGWETRPGIDAQQFGAPVPHPRQIFAVGLNYVEHAKESGLDLPAAPLVFTKFPSSITGPSGDIELSGERVDWEVELVVVIGEQARYIDEGDAWSHVAGFTIGQDISDRSVQQAGSSPQFSLGKSFDKYAPTGPWLVTLDEFKNRDDLRVESDLNGVKMQDSRTSDLVFSVSYLVSYLSRIVTLWPGDLIFTGTPSGVGMGRTPPRFLAGGDLLTTRIEGIGSMSHRFTSSR